MKKWMGLLVLLLILSGLGWAAEKDKKKQTQSEQPPAPPVSLYWTGDGGKGMSLTITVPKPNGFAENQKHLPLMAYNEFIANFKNYSAIDVLDWERLGDQYDIILSGYFDDNAKAGLDLGHLPATTHQMGGNITRTATGYTLQIQITKTADKMTTASYSGTFTFAELDNLSGIRRASLDLLQKMGVTLTAQAREELTGAAKDNQVQAQTALARGITAQRQGTEVAALSYYFQAAAYDPSLMEAASRSSILNANISSGNIGNDVRNDIQWRKDWVARLTETEQFFDSFNKTESMPYTLFYVSDEIKQVGEINYKNETVTMGGIETHLHGSGIWTVSIERALQAVYDGLDATKRKDTWGLGNWPRKSVTNLNFVGQKQNFAVVFELLNNQNKVIGKQTVQSGGSWGLDWGSGRPVINVNADDRKTLNFQNVNANDISDKMTIRVATVNGTDAGTAARSGVLQIRAIPRKEFDKNSRYRFVKGEIQGFANDAAKKEEIVSYIRELVIPNTIWGDPVMFIGNRAFANLDLHKVTIPNSVISIGSEAFVKNYLRSIKDGNGVTFIGAGAFKNAYGNTLTIPNNVTSIGEEAFRTEWESITIGANVTIGVSSYHDSFGLFYNENGKKAGTYKYIYTLNLSGISNIWRYNPLPSFSFPTQCMGTWKRDKFDNTLTFTANTVKASNQSNTWNLINVSGNDFTVTEPTNWITYESPKITIQTDKGGSLKISGDKRKGEDNWNGTWKRQ